MCVRSLIGTTESRHDRKARAHAIIGIARMASAHAYLTSRMAAAHETPDRPDHAGNGHPPSHQRSQARDSGVRSSRSQNPLETALLFGGRLPDNRMTAK